MAAAALVEWLEQMIHVEQVGSYLLRGRTARRGAGAGTVRFRFNGVDRTGILVVPLAGRCLTFRAPPKSLLVRRLYPLMPHDSLQSVADSSTVQLLQRFLNQLERSRIKLLSFVGRLWIPVMGDSGAADG